MACNGKVAYPAEPVKQRVAALIAYGELAQRRATQRRASAQRHIDFAHTAHATAVRAQARLNKSAVPTDDPATISRLGEGSSPSTLQYKNDHELGDHDR
jgi:hypothetical protein